MTTTRTGRGAAPRYPGKARGTVTRDHGGQRNLFLNAAVMRRSIIEVVRPWRSSSVEVLTEGEPELRVHANSDVRTPLLLASEELAAHMRSGVKLGLDFRLKMTERVRCYSSRATLARQRFP